MSRHDILLPNAERNKAGARLDSRAIREAVEFLGLTLPVRFKWTGQFRSSGRYRNRWRPGSFGEPGTYVHDITLSTYADAAQLSRSVWHELTHAAQSERHGDDEFDRLYARESKHYGYEGNRFEREAQSFADFATELPLAA